MYATIAGPPKAVRPSLRKEKKSSLMEAGLNNAPILLHPAMLPKDLTQLIKWTYLAVQVLNSRLIAEVYHNNTAPRNSRHYKHNFLLDLFLTFL